MAVYELNLDGLVGPNHNYAGLSAGNIASTSNALCSSNPKAAALQGIAKMRLLHRMGLKQGLLPPQQRPNLELLHQLGFRGSPAQQIEKAHRTAPELLAACYSASAMWTANAATVSPSLDTADHRIHFTAANLISNLHRHQEADFSQSLLKNLFSNESFFCHHQPLPRSFTTSDEGAANHSRLCRSHNRPGIHLFVYGKETLKTSSIEGPFKYPARQTLEASQAIVRAHRLNPDKVVFARQNPKAIDLGVFHNDVIAVANESVLFIHEDALVLQAEVLKEIQLKADFAVQVITVNSQDITLKEAVATYLFNSQLISLPNEPHKMAFIAPMECRANPRVEHLLDEIIADQSNPIVNAHYLDLKQSMRNGGGPACLRLRIALTEDELLAMHQGILVTDTLLEHLENWVMRHYRSQLDTNDLADPNLIDECLAALDELSKLLELGAIYPFQREING
ncbi:MULTISPECIES: N-succinylarginine dihydrolase [Legionella]|uniref:N-succinylarginine dihydrolase n=1 Tax=Legionella drozanskii LLAP-1 TaxID=1212489 RepID=A0A0W0TBS9_9GAMM|nr:MULTISPECIES: N-succinylarginine dihydrolase [Legionella]KTC93057.1 succinylarginine dihydrolase [Legionella drozanskii LLAP-1]PJE11961.1 MAG: N-succinylarginine dihydrolase [Legionella sp.]